MNYLPCPLKILKVVDHVSVFARVSPEHKLKIVKALQNKGHIVAMTGDSVNDVTIKAADIGIAMGIAGTDVAKETSSLVLLDDNFATIRKPSKKGGIFMKISENSSAICLLPMSAKPRHAFAMLLALPLPLVPIQILWVNLVTDGLPAMALGLDQPEEDVMRHQTRSPDEGSICPGIGVESGLAGFNRHCHIGGLYDGILSKSGRTRLCTDGCLCHPCVGPTDPCV